MIRIFLLMRTGFFLLIFSSFSFGQLWSNIISSSRAADWSTVGVVGGIPDTNWSNCVTTACNTLFGGSVTATTIQNAVSSAPTNTIVRLPVGIYSIAAFNITRNNVSLKGQGADQTKLVCTSGQSGGGLGGTNNPCIHLMSGATGIGSFGGFTSATWSSGYAQGSTQIVLSSISGLTFGPVGTGSLIMLDQQDDPQNGDYPSVGDLLSCVTAGAWCANQDGNNYARPGRAEVQVVTATAVNAGGCGSTCVTISPAIAYTNFRAARNPGAYWNSGSPISNVGLEDFTLDFTTPNSCSGGNTCRQGIYILNAANVWVTGVRLINTATGTQETYHIFVLQSQHVTIRSNYVWGRPTSGGANFPLANYALSEQEVSDMAVENNIFERNTESIVPNDPGGRNVYAYNLVTGGQVGANGTQYHSGNIMMDLYEGNNIETFYSDITHGTHNVETLYRNLFDGNSRNPGTTVGMAVALLANNRFFNIVGNVMGSTDYTTYEADQEGSSTCGTASIYNFGSAGCNSGVTVNTDPNVKRTVLRWGNWDMFTSTNRTGTSDQTGVRWCGNSSDTGWTTRCSSISEVPSGIPSFSNPIPTLGDTSAGMGPLPPSLYLDAKPTWFGSVPFPPIGPDVANGNAPNTTSVPTGGHANLIPARVCFNGLQPDGAYSGQTPQPRIFNANTCYSSQQQTPPHITVIIVGE